MIMLEFIKGCYFTLTSYHDERKKKTKKTQQVQYTDDDNHHDQSNEISHRGVVLYGKDGSVHKDAIIPSNILINPIINKSTKIRIKRNMKISPMFNRYTKFILIEKIKNYFIIKE